MRKIQTALYAIGLLTIISCSNNILNEGSDKTSLKVTVDGYSSGVNRSVVPDFTSQIDSYYITLTSGNGYTTRTQSVTTGSATFSDIETGSWDINVSAKNGSTIVGTGSLADQTISTGENNITVTLSYSQTGTGGFSLVVWFPASTGIDSVTGVMESPALTLTPTITAASDTSYNQVTFAVSGIAGGSHALVITFKKGSTVSGVFREAVNIWDNITSDKWLASDGSLSNERIFSADEFYSTNAKLSDLVLSQGTLSFASDTTSYDAGTISGSTLTITAAASVDGQYIQYKLNSGTLNELQPGTESGNITLSEGTNTIVVKVTAPDKQTEKEYTITIVSDTTAPTAGTGVSFSSTTSTGTTVSWGAASDSVTAAASLSYKVVQASSSAAIDTVSEVDDVTTAGSGLVMDWTVNTLTAAVTGLSDSATYYFAVLVKDAVGNMSLYTPVSVTTTDGTAPTTGTGVSFADTTSTGTTVNWGAASDNVTAAANLSYKVVQASSSAAIGTVSEADAATVTMAWTANTLTTTVTGLSSSTTYYFAVLVKDAAGNENLYTPASVTTTASGDTTPPTLSSVSYSDAVATTVTVSATSDEAGTMYYVITTSSTSPTATQVAAGQNNSGTSAAASGNSAVSASTAKSFSVTGLSNFTKYYYYIAAVDSSDNKSSVSGGSFATIGDDCVARYTFENATTDSVGSYDLSTPVGTASYSSSQKKEGTAALLLDGSTSLTTSFTLSDTESISAWVYLDASAGSFPTPIALGGSTGLQFFYDSGKLTGAIGTGITVEKTFTSGMWHHIVLTAMKNSDGLNHTLYLYVDGYQYTSNAGTADYNSGITTLYIGDDGSTSYYWKGYIDDVQIYSRVLSDTEVTSLYNTY
jgi:hypothetical protein